MAPATTIYRQKPSHKSNLTALKRQRRWVKLHSRRKHSTNGVALSNSFIDTNILSSNDIETKKNDPFVQMAKTFCNQIGQNGNVQMLSWCIEKALRRLKYLGVKSTYKPVQGTKTIKKELDLKSKSDLSNNMPEKTAKVDFIKMAEVTSSTNEMKPPATTSASPTSSSTAATTAASTTLSPELKASTVSVFFPDNTALENNLQQYELTDDDTGNVYFEGSLHASDVVHSHEDDAVSDVVPGMDSDSRAELDPATLRLQARRRENVRRINESILKRIAKG